jgi:hypothetical protein
LVVGYNLSFAAKGILVASVPTIKKIVAKANP